MKKLNPNNDTALHCQALFPHLFELIQNENRRQNDENRFYIENGYFSHWAFEHSTFSDCAAILDIASRPEPWDYFSICATLKIVTGKPWEFTCIRGDCQGDWQDVILSDNDWSADALHDFEVEYFNTGCEWQIFGYTDDDQTPDDFGMIYTHGYSNGDAIKEISAVLAADPDEITLQHFTGRKQIPEWEEV